MVQAPISHGVEPPSDQLLLPVGVRRARSSQGELTGLCCASSRSQTGAGGWHPGHSRELPPSPGTLRGPSPQGDPWGSSSRLSAASAVRPLQTAPAAPTWKPSTDHGPVGSSPLPLFLLFRLTPSRTSSRRRLHAAVTREEEAFLTGSPSRKLVENHYLLELKVLNWLEWDGTCQPQTSL